MEQKDVKNNSRSKYNYTVTSKLFCRKAGFMTSVPNFLITGQNSRVSEVTANGMLTLHLSCSYRHVFTDRNIYEHACIFVFNIPTSDLSK
jgi:hypothetical protein